MALLADQAASEMMATCFSPVMKDSPLPVLHSPVRLQGDAAAGCLGDDGHVFLSRHEAILLCAVEELQADTLVSAPALVPELSSLVVHHNSPLPARHLADQAGTTELVNKLVQRVGGQIRAEVFDLGQELLLHLHGSLYPPCLWWSAP